MLLFTFLKSLFILKTENISLILEEYFWKERFMQMRKVKKQKSVNSMKIVTLCWTWEPLPEYSTYMPWVVAECWNPVLFLSSRRIRVSPRKTWAENRENTSLLPDLLTPDAEKELSRGAVCLNWSYAPVTFGPPLSAFTLASWASAGSCRKLCCDRTALLLPTICSKCVEPSVCKTGRPRFPFSLRLVSLFSGASLLPVWLLGLGSSPTMGFLKLRSRGWGPSAAGLRAIHY